MRVLSGSNLGWFALPFVIAVGILYIAVISWVLGKSQSARDESIRKAA